LHQHLEHLLPRSDFKNAKEIEKETTTYAAAAKNKEEAKSSFL
jgi:hypothetical protein